MPAKDVRAYRVYAREGGVVLTILLFKKTWRNFCLGGPQTSRKETLWLHSKLETNTKKEMKMKMGIKNKDTTDNNLGIHVDLAHVL